MDATLDLQEKKQHGTDLFPFVIYRPPLNDHYPIVYVHWHKEVEIILFKQGSATYTIESDKYELESGDFFMVQPGRIHSASTRSCPYSDIYAIIFDMGALLGSTADSCTLNYLAPLVSGQYRLPALIKNGTELCARLTCCAEKMIDAFLSEKPFYELTIKSLLLEFIEIMYSGGCIETKLASNPQGIQYSDRIKYAIKYINSNYNQEIYLEMLAKEIGYSVNHLIRLFRTATGMTPLAYLNRIRLLRAAELLMKTEKSVTEISLDIGYVNISYFQKNFKTLFRLPPAQYRKAYLAYVEHLASHSKGSCPSPMLGSEGQWTPAG